MEKALSQGRDDRRAEEVDVDGDCGGVLGVAGRGRRGTGGRPGRWVTICKGGLDDLSSVGDSILRNGSLS